MSVVVDQKDAFGANELSIGRELDGRFTVLEKLSEGGMGAVYRAHQRSVDREVAIKVVRLDLIANPEAIKLFLREAKLTSKLNHPNAVAVLDFGQTEDGVFYLAMELVKGRPLDRVLREEGALTAGRVVRIGMQVCDALETAHAMEIVHRDLKPANIMLVDSRRDFVKVLDFGLAKTLSTHRDFAFTDEELMQIPADHTQVTTMLGTPAFLPPERTINGTADARSDLYSLGCVLYLLACGRLPFDAATPKELVLAHTTQRPPLLDCVPPTIAAVIDRLLSKDPADRYQSAAETRDALEEAALIDHVPAYQSSPSIEQARLSGRISAPSIPIAQRAPSAPIAQPVEAPPKKRRAALLVGIGAFALGMAALIAVSIGRGSSEAESAPVTTKPVVQPAEERVDGSASPPPPPVNKTVDEPEPKLDGAVKPEPKLQPVAKPTIKKIRPRPVKQPPPPATPPPATNNGKPKLPF